MKKRSTSVLFGLVLCITSLTALVKLAAIERSQGESDPAGAHGRMVDEHPLQAAHR